MDQKLLLIHDAGTKCVAGCAKNLLILIQKILNQNVTNIKENIFHKYICKWCVILVGRVRTVGCETKYVQFC